MNKIFLGEGEITRAIINYFSLFIDGKLEVSKYLFMGADRVHVGFSLLVRDENNTIIQKLRITEKDLDEVFKNYLKESQNEYIEFKYIGGVRKEGYYQGEEVPYFDGIQIETRPKEIEQNLAL